MIDLKLLLNDFDFVKERLQMRKFEGLEDLVALVVRYKKNLQDLESKQEIQNSLSKKFPQSDNKDELRERLSENKKLIEACKVAFEESKNALHEKLFLIPNLPDSKTPFGGDESENKVLETFGEVRKFDFPPLSHYELAQKNLWIDFERGVKLAKSRFSVLRNLGAKLNFALINFMLEHNQNAGFELVATPCIVNADMLFGTGQLPKFSQDMFEINGDFEEEKHKLYLISTSEITLTNLYHDEILKSSDLPIMLTAQTPCFRKEAGSAGRDTKGIIRQHQFDKVELVALTHPEESDSMQEKMVKTAREILERLELPYRAVQLCSGDLGFSASNTVDLEVWLPSQNKYREISSISNTRDFQARRAKIRFKNGDKNTLVHTLNGSSLAVGRTLVAIMENYQREDGSIEIPKVLKKYL